MNKIYKINFTMNLHIISTFLWNCKFQFRCINLMFGTRQIGKKLMCSQQLHNSYTIQFYIFSRPVTMKYFITPWRVTCCQILLTFIIMVVIQSLSQTWRGDNFVIFTSHFITQAILSERPFCTLILGLIANINYFHAI